MDPQSINTLNTILMGLLALGGFLWSVRIQIKSEQHTDQVESKSDLQKNYERVIKERDEARALVKMYEEDLADRIVRLVEARLEKKP
jgi:nitrogen fixation-related uncharacterized protein